ncbi:unnamed protein product [Amoebophrya sp. A120]|nr:unnamed protein product [Amoebophrya sp. A120]|eukprot:GSA120T00003189001.1
MPLPSFLLCSGSLFFIQFCTSGWSATWVPVCMDERRQKQVSSASFSFTRSAMSLHLFRPRKRASPWPSKHVSLLRLFLLPVSWLPASLLPVGTRAKLATRAEGKQRAITKIVKLLEKMEDQLEKDQDADDDAKTKMDCWCKNNALEKTDAVKQKEAEIRQLNSEIAAQGAEAARLKLSLEQLEKDLAENAQEIVEAEERREREHEENQKAILELTESVGQINSAIVVLRKNTDSARAGAVLMKLKSKVQAGGQASLLSAALREKLFGLNQLSATASTSEQKISANYKATATSPPSKGASFLQADQTEQQTPLDTTSVVSMLTEMQVTFQANLQETEQREEQAVTAYLQLREDRSQQAERMREQRTTKHEALARAVEAEADAKVALSEAEEMLDSLDGWISEARKICAEAEDMYAVRTKERSEERKALGEAVGILASDEARDAFKKVQPLEGTSGAATSFLQLGVWRSPAMSLITSASVQMERLFRPIFELDTNGRRKQLAVELLQAAKIKKEQLRQTPSGERTGKALDSVVERILGLIADLKSENREEQIEKARCQKSMHDHSLEDQRLSNEVQKTETEEGLLQGKLEGLEKDEEQAKEEKKDLEKQMAKAEKNHEAEKADLETQIGDQIAVQKLLIRALRALQAFYDKKASADELEETMGDDSSAATTTVPATLFVQKTSSGVSAATALRRFRQDPPPPQFQAYEAHDYRHGVLQMLENVKNEAVSAQQQLERSMSEAIANYGALVSENTKTMEALQTKLADLDAEQAATTKDLSATQEELKNLKAEHYTLTEAMAGERKLCLPVLEKFAQNQEARTREAEALNEAIAILKGADIDSGEFAEKTLGNP